MSRWLTSDEKSDLGALLSKLKESYNDVTTDGVANITMKNKDSGIAKTVSVSGSGSGGSVQAYNSSSFSNNTIQFGYTTGVGSDTLPLPSIDALETTVSNHAESIENIHDRDAYKLTYVHPDIDMETNSVSVNSRTYVASASSQLGSNSPNRGFWRTDLEWRSNNEYTTLAGDGVNYMYSGSANIGSGTSGEWLKISLPSAIVISAFTIKGAPDRCLPRSFSIYGSNDDSTYTRLITVNNETVSSTDAGSCIAVDPGAPGYLNAYSYYGIQITKIAPSTAHPADRNAVIRHLAYHEMPVPFEKWIPKFSDCFTTANINGSGELVLDNIGGSSTTLTLPAPDLSSYFQTSNFESTLAGYTNTGSLAVPGPWSTLAVLSDITNELGSYYDKTDSDARYVQGRYDAIRSVPACSRLY